MASIATRVSNRKDGIPKGRKQPEWNRQPTLFKRKPGAKENKINGVPLLARTLLGYNIDVKTLQFFKHSWRPSTRKCYITHINRWSIWAIENGVKVLDPPLAAVLKYLHIYFEKGVGYGAINAARCALSLILPRSQGATIGEHFLVKGGLYPSLGKQTNRE